jgi:hypothetical protein
MDDCIDKFEDAVRRHAGQWWAATSAFPCSKDELLEELLERRSAANYGDETYRRLTGLMIDLTRFVPEGDLELAAPYMSVGGAISGRSRPDPADEAARVRAYEVIEVHRDVRNLFLGRLRLDPRYRQPIGSPVWTPMAQYRGGSDTTANDGTTKGAGAHWYLLGLLMLLPEIILSRLKRLLKR